MKVLFNNSLTDELSLPATDRALQFGDGLFETICVHKGKPQFLREHLSRLAEGCRALALSFEPEYQEWENKIEHILKENHIAESGRVKLMTWRKPCERAGYGFDTNEVHTLLSAVSTKLQKTVSIKSNVGISNEIRLSKTSYSKFKTLNALPYIVASQERDNRNMEDLILMDMNDNISEFISANVFWLTNNTLFTPSTDSGCLSGITIGQIKRIVKKIGIQVKEGLYSMDDLHEADFVAGCNSMTFFCISDLNEITYNTDNELVKSIFKELYSS